MGKPVPFGPVVTLGFAGLAAALAMCLQVETSAQQPSTTTAANPSTPSSHRQLLDRYCVSCHNDKAKTGGLSLQQVDPSSPAAHPDIWEKVVRKVNTGTMPPPTMPQPSRDARVALQTWLEAELD
jgi:mono/diheme cytochrome c family protein